MRDRKLKHWEMALMLGVLCALILGTWLNQEQQELAEQMIRFHVIANSNTQEDQALKLAVRDQVLAQAETLYPAQASMEQAKHALEGQLSALAEAGRGVVEGAGYDYPVSAQMTRCWFPTKDYGDFSLPAGEYTALRIVIGEGAGENWWCVAFPPLCLGAATTTVEEAREAGFLTQGQAGLVTGANEGYVLKFKSMELLGQVQGMLGK